MTSTVPPIDVPERQLKYIDIGLLRFDPENPRFPASADRQSDDAHMRWLLEEAGLIELMGAIGSQGFFPGEPLLVTPQGDGTYIVVEGNRRLAACRLLLEPELAPTRKRSVAAVAESSEFKPETLPTLEFDHRDDILGFLGYRHITGIKEWGPLAKARYLRQLWESSDPSASLEDRLRGVARGIGSRSDYVARLLTGLALYNRVEANDFYAISGLDDEGIDFSLFTVALNRPAFITFLGVPDIYSFEDLSGLNAEHLELLTRWLFEKSADGKTLLGESRFVGELAAAIDDVEGLAALKAGATRREAYLLTITPDGVIAKSLLSAKENVSACLRALSGGREAAADDLLLVEGLLDLLARVDELIRNQLDSAPGEEPVMRP